MICQACGVEATTKYVAFYCNIGMLVMRFSKSAEGHMCKSCIHRTFWQFTLTNLTLGWWGLISFIVTPFLILNNLFRYLFCLGMEPVPPGAVQPELTKEVVERLQSRTDKLIDQLNRGDDFERVAENIAMETGVTKGQVALYIHALIAASQNAEHS
jgi:hypothetical protein